MTPNLLITPKPNPQPQPTPVRGPSILLAGPPGSGKTYSLVTLLDAGLELFVIVTEPNGLETLLDAARKRGHAPERIRYRVIEPAKAGFNELHDIAVKVTQMGFDGLSRMAPTERSKAQFLQVVSTFSNFKDDRTGVTHGNVSTFGPDKVVVLDSLSGLNLMAMDLVIGDKVTAAQGEWGVAMNMLDKILLSLTSNLKCIFVLTAHIEPERDEITGGVKLMTSTLGRKLAPKIPRFFSEVILTYTEGANFYWSTSNPSMDLKHRSLPLGNKIKPDFEPIVTAYKQRFTLGDQDPMNDAMNRPLPLQNSDPFDINDFMNTPVEGVGSTQVTPIPAGKRVALIGAGDNDVRLSTFTARETQEQGLMLSITFIFVDDDGALRAAIDGREPKHTQTYFLDTCNNPATGRMMLDMGKGKNVQLNRLRSAVGQNDGKPWAPPMLKGAGPLLVDIVVQPDKRDRETPRNHIKSVGAIANPLTQ